MFFLDAVNSFSKYVLTILLYGIVCHTSFSQGIATLGNDGEIIDSLETAYKEEANDSLRSLLLFRLSGFNKKNRQDEEYKKHLELALQSAKGNQFLMDYSGYFQALKYLNYTDIEKFIVEVIETQQKLKKYDNEKSVQLQLIILQNVSTYYGNEMQYEKCIDILIKEAIPLAIKTHNDTLLASFYKNIAGSFYMMEQFEKAEEYFDRALELFLNGKPYKEDLLVLCYVDAARNLLNVNKFNKVDSLLQKAEVILKESPYSYIQADFFYVKGEYYFLQEEYTNALKNYDLGMEQLSFSRVEYLDINLKTSKASALNKLKRFEEAADLLSELEPASDLPAQYRINYFTVYANTLEGLKRYRDALDVSRQFVQLKDSLDKEINKKSVMELEAKYQNAESEKKISQLESEKELAQLAANNNRLHNGLLTVSTAFLLIFVTFSWFYFKKNKKLSKQKEINYQHRLKELEQLQQLNSAKAILSGEEKERKRVAQDLHDGLGGVLAGIKMNLSRITDNKANVDDALEQVKEKVDYSLIELRRIARNMMPESLLKFGLDTALKDLCEMYRTPDVMIAYESFQLENTIPQQNQLLIYRIVQELLSNALKHSDASHIIVQCSQNEKRVFLTVEDNGHGFEKSILMEKSGMGFNNIKNRVAYLGGLFEINTMPDAGTTINIELDVFK